MQIRQRIAQINHGDRLFVSAEVADFLDYLRAIGVSQRTVQLERDLWILVQSISPKAAAILIDDKRAAIADPEFCALYLDYDAAFTWRRDDVRLATLAERSKAWYAKQSGKTTNRGKSVLDSTIQQLVATFYSELSPAWTRLGELTKER